jgi:hypothetical protein
MPFIRSSSTDSWNALYIHVVGSFSVDINGVHKYAGHMTSFNIEQAREQDKSRNDYYNGVKLWIVGHHREVEVRFLEVMETLPTWGDSHGLASQAVLRLCVS